MKYYKILVFPLAFILGGCAATGPVFKEVSDIDKSKALVYIYRTDSQYFSTRDAYFYVNGHNIVDLSNNGYTWFYLPEGKHTLKQKWPVDIQANTLEVPLHVKRGKTYYYRFKTGICGKAAICLSWNLKDKREKRALFQLKNSRLQPAFNVADFAKNSSN